MGIAPECGGGERRLASLVLSLTAPGRLEIVVETASPSDAAMLTITTGAGLVRERAQTLGDTVWVHFVT